MWINADTCKPKQDIISTLSERVVVAVLNTRTGATFTDWDCYHYGKGRWQRWEALGYFTTYKVTHWMPITMPEQEMEKRKRNPYQKGAKSYLSSFVIGESRQYEGTPQQYRSLQSMATTMKEEYGCVWRFRKKGEIMIITRTQ